MHEKCVFLSVFELVHGGVGGGRGDGDGDADSGRDDGDADGGDAGVMVMVMMVVEAARCDRTARLPLPTASAPAADHATAALVTRRPSPAGGLAHTPAAARYDLIWRW